MAKKLIAKSPVEHDGKVLAEGTAFTVKDDDQADALVAAGAAIEVVSEAKKAAE